MPTDNQTYTDTLKQLQNSVGGRGNKISPRGFPFNNFSNNLILISLSRLAICLRDANEVLRSLPDRNPGT